MTSPVLVAVPVPVRGATPRFCAFGAGELAGATTAISTPVAVCPAATVMEFAVAGDPPPLPLLGGATAFALAGGDTAVPPHPMRKTKERRTAESFTVSSC